MDSRQRRQIILARQRLTAPADPETVCRDLNGLQAQFFSYTRHGMATRCRSSLGPDWSRGLVKSWTVRGTMHLFREADLPLFLHRDRGHFLRDVDRFADDQFADEARKRYFAQVILEGIDSGDGAREDLRLLCRRAGMTDREEEGLFNGWGGLLRAMAEAGMICYQPREEKVFRRCPPFTPMDREAAELELARRYFAHFGPATVRDAAYYFHTSQKQVRARIAAALKLFSVDPSHIIDVHRVAFLGLPAFLLHGIGSQRRLDLIFHILIGYCLDGFFHSNTLILSQGYTLLHIDVLHQIRCGHFRALTGSIPLRLRILLCLRIGADLFRLGSIRVRIGSILTASGTSGADAQHHHRHQQLFFHNLLAF